MKIGNLKSVANFCRDSSGTFTEAAVRWWIFNETTNGFARAGVTVRIGRRVYIDIEAFERWVESQNEWLGKK